MNNNSFDINVRTLDFHNRKIEIHYVSSLCSDELIAYLVEGITNAKGKTLKDCLNNGDVKEETEISQYEYAMLTGCAIVKDLEKQKVYVLDTRHFPSRSIDEPDTEKTVRGISILFLVIFSFLTYKNYYYSPLIVLTIMMYFSTKGVQMFENRIFLSTRVIFWLLFSTLLFLRIYFNESSHLDMKNTKTLLTISLISICIGTWVGDFFAKYIYIRIKFCINRFFSTSNKGTYRIVKMENTQQNYMKSLGKKMGIMFYHITLDVNGEEKKFLLEKELFEKLQGKSEININIKKGCLGICYGVGMQE